MPVVGFEMSSLTVQEEDGGVELCVAITNSPPGYYSELPITINLSTTDVTAGMVINTHCACIIVRVIVYRSMFVGKAVVINWRVLV